ncbi:MAG: laccase domain-containing protein [Candidatus Saccharibacteria bacterium]
MKSTNPDEQSQFDQNRKIFLEKNGISPNDTTLVRLDYETNDYCRYVSIDDINKGDGIVSESTILSDALIVAKPNHALLLPLADCIGAVIYASTVNILMLAHLGRHNLEQFGGTKCIEYLVNKFDVQPDQLTVWLSPAAGKSTYPLFAFNNRGLHEVAIEQLITAGVDAGKITVSPIDSSTDDNYYSHSNFLHGKQNDDGRFAVVVYLN